MPEHRARKHHQDRVAEMMRLEIITMIEGELHVKRIHPCYVSEVALYPGGKSARVYVAVDSAVPDIEKAEKETVEGLEAAHDTICGSIVRMVHLAAGEPEVAKLAALHARFETAYAKHSAEEAKLFDGLDGLLDEAQRHELAERLRGL